MNHRLVSSFAIRLRDVDGGWVSNFNWLTGRFKLDEQPRAVILSERQVKIVLGWLGHLGATKLLKDLEPVVFHDIRDLQRCELYHVDDMELKS